MEAKKLRMSVGTEGIGEERKEMNAKNGMEEGKQEG